MIPYGHLNVNLYLSNLQQANCIKSSKESKNQDNAEEHRGNNKYKILPSLKKNIDKPIIRPDQKPKHKLQLNNSLSSLDLFVINDLGAFSIDPCLRIHIKPTEDINSIIIKLWHSFRYSHKMVFC